MVYNPFKAAPLYNDPLPTLGKFALDQLTQSPSEGPPQTRTQTAYALTIHATVGNRRGRIGAIHELGQSQSRTVEERFEICSNAVGLPIELVPQIVTGRTLTINRYDLYGSTMEEVFGFPNALHMLSAQTAPISLRLSWRDPNGSALGAALNPNFFSPSVKVLEFYDCYFTQIGRTVSMDSIIVQANASLVWRKVRQLQ